jgi:hypothetical protein
LQRGEIIELFIISLGRSKSLTAAGIMKYDALAACCDEFAARI